MADGCLRKSGRFNLETDGKLSTQTLTLIKSLFKASAPLKPPITAAGLPRGIIISTSLAELKLKQLDEKIGSIEGVYLALRYVDDILVFSTGDAEETKIKVISAINSIGLEANAKKTYALRVACACEKVCSHSGTCPCSKSCNCLSKSPSLAKSVEYLGYKFAFPAHVKAKERATVYCLLSDRKIARTKFRISRAFLSFLDTKNEKLIEKRIRYLSGNQAVLRSTNRRSLLTGLAYTHTEYSAPQESCIFDCNLIIELDKFYRTLLRKHASSFTPSAVDRLKKLSFQSGFEFKRRVKFSRDEVIAIEECWEIK